MLSLGINIDHVATLRQQRGTEYPNPLSAAELALQAGADGITLHLREDRRHIQDRDVYKLREMADIRMNLECAITQEMLDIACAVQPHAVCLVPERREELTTEGGLDVQRHFDSVQAAVHMLQNKGIQVSLFIDPDANQIQAAFATGAPVVELHTGAYAEASNSTIKQELHRIEQAAALALDTGLCVHAGHGLHYQNVMDIAVIPAISELNIGHAIVAQSIFDGWIPAVRFMKILMVMSREDRELAQYYGTQLHDFSFAGAEARLQLMQWYDVYLSTQSDTIPA